METLSENCPLLCTKQNTFSLYTSEIRYTYLHKNILSTISGASLFGAESTKANFHGANLAGADLELGDFE